jgi:hypothetical protein
VIPIIKISENFQKTIQNVNTQYEEENDITFNLEGIVRIGYKSGF